MELISRVTVEAVRTPRSAILQQIPRVIWIMGQQMSPNVISTAATAPCAMEPNCQWSAPYCFWHAFFAVFLFS